MNTGKLCGTWAENRSPGCGFQYNIVWKHSSFEKKSPFTLNFRKIRLLILFTALFFNLFTIGTFEVGERFGMESGAD